MELRGLRYFLEVARCGSFTLAANALHLTQPTLSRQIQDLEEELGVELFRRGQRKTELTEAGQRLVRKSRQILELAEQTRKEMMGEPDRITGDVYIAGGESRGMAFIGGLIHQMLNDHPDVRFHLFSGNAESVAEKIEKDLADFGIFILPAPLADFHYIRLPISDLWGLLLRTDHRLASKEFIRPADLADIPLICSAQQMVDNVMGGWLGDIGKSLRIVATYNLLYNVSILVREGVGCALCIDGIADVSPASQLCFRPLEPALRVSLAIAWKRDNKFSAAASTFQKYLLAATTVNAG